MERKIEYRCEKGWPSNLESRFRSRVSGYVQDCKRYKIGITNDPENRFSQSDYRAYNRMIVIYQTQSWDSAGDFEDRLIEYYKDDYACDAIRAGGAGRKGKKTPYFLYVVINDE